MASCLSRRAASVVPPLLFGLQLLCVGGLLQRDVPGMTRASIPVLSGLGVKAVSSGVNGFSAPPGVPKVRKGGGAKWLTEG